MQMLDIAVQIKYCILCCFAVIVFSNCESDLASKEYLQWVESPKNGLKKVKTIKPYFFSVQYKPLEYIIAQEARKETVDTDFFNQRKSDLGDEMLYFNLQIGPASGQTTVLQEVVDTEEEYNRVISYLSFEMQNDLYLLDGLDTIKCSLFHFARDFDLTPNLDFALGFEKRKNKKLTFVYDDKIFNTATVKIAYSEKDLITSPKLKID